MPPLHIQENTSPTAAPPKTVVLHTTISTTTRWLATGFDGLRSANMINRVYRKKQQDGSQLTYFSTIHWQMLTQPVADSFIRTRTA